MGDREHRELLARWYTYLLFYLLILVLLLPTNHSQLAPSLSFHFRILTHAFDQQRIMPPAHAIGILAGAVAAEVLEQSMWSCARCVSAKHATHSHEHLREHGAIWRERAHGEGERR